jgi:hypothetical protein
MISASRRVPTAEGLGSVSWAPGLRAGLRTRLRGRYVDIGELRPHAVIGDDGPPHLAFNQLPEITNGSSEDGNTSFFGAQFDALAGGRKLPDCAVKYYIDELTCDAEALRSSFELDRAFLRIIAQHEQRKIRRLIMPALAIGGAQSAGEGSGTR